MIKIPAIFGTLLYDATAGSLTCIHGGTWIGTQDTNVKFDGKTVCVISGGFKPGSTPCTGIPPSVPPCQLPTSISFATRVKAGGVFVVTEMTPQTSVSNGMPSFTPKTKSVKVKVL